MVEDGQPLSTAAVVDLFVLKSVLIADDVLLDSFSSHLNVPVLIVFLTVNVLTKISNINNVPFSGCPFTCVMDGLTLTVVLLSNKVHARTDSFHITLKPTLSLTALNILVASNLANVVTT